MPGSSGGSPGGSQDGSADGGADGSADGGVDGSEDGTAGAEPGWGEPDYGDTADSAGAGGSGGAGDALPDLSDPDLSDPDLGDDGGLDESLEDFDDAMENAGAAGAGGPGGPPGGFGGTAGGSDGDGGGDGPVSGGGGGMTAAEQVAILDGQLEQGTGDFDQMILDERDIIRDTTEGEQGDLPENLEDYGYPGGGSGSGEGEGYGAPPMGGSGGGGAGVVPRATPDADFPQQAANYPPPGDIPSGDDDDVVARQIREAAMSEPDPVLREKLWDEYRDYKGISK